MITLDEMREDVIQKIEAAFPKNPHPKRGRNVREEEKGTEVGLQIEAILDGKVWDELNLEDIRQFNDPRFLLALNQDALAYYLPAFLIATLRHIEELSQLASGVVQILMVIGADQVKVVIIGKDKLEAIAGYLDTVELVQSEMDDGDKSFLNLIEYAIEQLAPFLNRYAEHQAVLDKFGTVDEHGQKVLEKIRQAFSTEVQRKRTKRWIEELELFSRRTSRDIYYVGVSEQLMNLFAGKRWEDIWNNENILYYMSEIDYLRLISEEAFAYYLPAFLSATIGDPHEWMYTFSVIDRIKANFAQTCF